MDDIILKVFISYSWDSDEHKEWVLNLANRISKLPGVHVIFDGYDLKPGVDKHAFIDKAIKDANKVLIILTPNYAIKADKRKGGVGEEYSIIRSEMINFDGEQIKFIPVLKDGDREISCPSFLKRLIDLDMRDEDKFDENYNELLRQIFEKYKITRPDIQEKLPDFLK